MVPRVPGVTATLPRRPLLLCALTLLLSVPFWVLGLATGGTLPGIGVSVAVGMVVVPAIVATALAHGEGGRAGVRALWSQLRPRARGGWPPQSRRWWVVAVGLVPALTVFALALTVLLDPDAPPVGEVGLGGALLSALLSAPALVLLAVLEEIAWAGYATPPLRRRWGPLGAGVVTGLVWAAWHVVPWLQVNGAGWTGWLVVSTIAMRVVIVVVGTALGDSLWAAVLIHAMSNICFVASGELYHPAPVALLMAMAAVGGRGRLGKGRALRRAAFLDSGP